MEFAAHRGCYERALYTVTPAVPFCHLSFSASRPVERRYERVKVPAGTLGANFPRAALVPRSGAVAGSERDRRQHRHVSELGSEPQRPDREASSPRGRFSRLRLATHACTARGAHSASPNSSRTLSTATCSNTARTSGHNSSLGGLRARTVKVASQPTGELGFVSKLLNRTQEVS